MHLPLDNLKKICYNINIRKNKGCGYLMSHYVICSVCGARFDRDKEQAVKTGARRYAHYKCSPNSELVPLPQKEEDPDLTKLKDYINKIFGKNANWAQINRQIKIYTTENKYSLSGILKSLIYFYEVKGNSIEKSNYALGIVPFVYNDAYNYYYSLFIAQSQNENKDVQKITNRVKEIVIPLPQIILPKRFFNLDDDEEVINEQ